uniref:Uncharacterized protein n=1 Tax=Rhodnius prolixus TaxID=13249 RepID=T1I0K4_RHOPR
MPAPSEEVEGIIPCPPELPLVASLDPAPVEVHTLNRDGLYDIEATVTVDEKDLTSPATFDCILRIPETNYTVRKSTIYYTVFRLNNVRNNPNKLRFISPVTYEYRALFLLQERVGIFFPLNNVRNNPNKLRFISTVTYEYRALFLLQERVGISPRPSTTSSTVKPTTTMLASDSLSSYRTGERSNSWRTTSHTTQLYRGQPDDSSLNGSGKEDPVLKRKLALFLFLF